MPVVVVKKVSRFVKAGGEVSRDREDRSLGPVGYWLSTGHLRGVSRDL